MKSLEEIKILVVGDIMLDKYVVGDVQRISPEAPVPIINVTDEYETLGGCGNVVRNLRELGCAVDCLASIGLDPDGAIIEDELKKIGVRPLLVTASRMTTVKERFIADHRQIQMLRVDREYIDLVNHHRLIDLMKERTRDNYNIVIVSDYGKGVVSYELMVYLKYHQNADIIVDPKPQNSGLYNGVFMITPNEKEWRDIRTRPYHLQNIKFILETKGNKGMRLIENQRSIEHDIPSEDVPVYNVSGAGDTVIATMGVCLGAGLDVLTSAKIANKCAGYAVTQPGTSVVPKKIFLENIRNI